MGRAAIEMQTTARMLRIDTPTIPHEHIAGYAAFITSRAAFLHGEIIAT
jgi:hypothetical protein